MHWNARCEIKACNSDKTLFQQRKHLVKESEHGIGLSSNERPREVSSELIVYTEVIWNFNCIKY